MSESQSHQEAVETEPAQEGDSPNGVEAEVSDAPEATPSVPPSDGEGGGRIDERWSNEEELPNLKRALESLVFVSDRIVTHVQLARMMRARPALVRQVLADLVEETSSRGVQLVEVSGGFQYRTAPESAQFVRELVSQKPVRLTRAQLETLALVAYRQPMTRPEIDDVRGVDTGSAIKVLLDRGLIKMLGRKDEAGRPMLYGTTPYFLEFFGLKSLKDLPTLKEFTDLSDDSRALFKRKTGESVDDSLPPPAGDLNSDDELDQTWDDDEEDAAEVSNEAGEAGAKDEQGQLAEGAASTSEELSEQPASEETSGDVVVENTSTHSTD